MPTHTPGPWTVAPGNPAHVFTGKHAKPIQCPTQADARLIAAAPELAGLLAEAPCTCPEWETGLGMVFEHDKEHAGCFRNRARAALAKAGI